MKLPSGLKSIVNVFYVDDEPQSDTPPAAPPAQRPAPSSPPQATSTPTQSMGTSTTSGGVITPSFMEALEQHLLELNEPGPDYIEFRSQLGVMLKAGLPEDAAYKAAFATIAAQGATLERIRTACSRYLQQLGQQTVVFKQEMEGLRATQVTVHEQALQQLNQDNARMAEQINELTQRIAANQEAMAGLQGRISEGTQKISSATLNFEVTLQEFTRRMQDDVTKLERYAASLAAPQG